MLISLFYQKSYRWCFNQSAPMKAFVQLTFILFGLISVSGRVIHKRGLAEPDSNKTASKTETSTGIQDSSIQPAVNSARNPSPTSRFLRPHGINWARVNKASAVPLFKRLRRDCDLFITASTNDTCCSLAASNNLSLSQFLLFNPTVDCDNLNSTSVCVTLKLQGEVREKRSGFRRRYHRRYGGYNTANQGYGIGDYGGQGDYGTSDYGSDYYDDYY